MKVLCVDASIGKHNKSVPNFKEGEICEAVQCPIIDECYEINGGWTSWYKTRFVPISNIDEMELLEQREALLQ